MPNEKPAPNVEALIASAVDVLTGSERQAGSAVVEITVGIVDRLAGVLSDLNTRGLVRDRHARMTIEDYNGQRVFMGRPTPTPPRSYTAERIVRQGIYGAGLILAAGAGAAAAILLLAGLSCPTG